MKPDVAVNQIEALRASIFEHCGGEDGWGHMGILDMTDRPWSANDNSAFYWPAGHVLTDPEDDPDYGTQEQEIESPYLLVGSEFTLVIGDISMSRREEIWLLDNAKRFTG